jgi:hypothetical protein
MASLESVNLLSRILCPVCLIASPVSLALIYMSPVTPESQPSMTAYVVVTVVSLLGFFTSFWYCRTRLGWFQKKK